MEQDYLTLLEDIEKELLKYSQFLSENEKDNLEMYNLSYYQEILEELKELKNLLLDTLKIVNVNSLDLIAEKIKYLLNDVEDKEKILNNLIIILNNKKEFEELL